jgi:hypothetical protein
MRRLLMTVAGFAAGVAVAVVLSARRELQASGPSDDRAASGTVRPDA